MWGTEFRVRVERFGFVLCRSRYPSGHGECQDHSSGGYKVPGRSVHPLFHFQAVLLGTQQLQKASIHIHVHMYRI